MRLCAATCWITTATRDSRTRFGRSNGRHGVCTNNIRFELDNLLYNGTRRSRQKASRWERKGKNASAKQPYIERGINYVKATDKRKPCGLLSRQKSAYEAVSVCTLVNDRFCQRGWAACQPCLTQSIVSWLSLFPFFMPTKSV